MNLGTAIADATMRAAAETIRATGRDPMSVDVDALMVACRREAKAALRTVLDDGKALLDGGRSSWLSTLMATECSAAGRRAAQDVL
jgi:hypothetical protein